MNQEQKNIGWMILVVIGIVAALYCYYNVNETFEYGVVTFSIASVCVVGLYHFGVKVDRPKTEVVTEPTQ
jgi:hypothetical protein